ncbi:MAG: hypothetical protein WCI71_05335, partial [Bacteroidota bacterium]
MSRVPVFIGFIFISLVFQGIIWRIPAQIPYSRVGVISVQDKLKPDEILLEYCITDSSLNIRAITDHANTVSQQKLVPVFWSLVTKFKRSLCIADPCGF